MTKLLLSFTKMHALGNDFVVISSADLRSTTCGTRLLSQWPQLVTKIAPVLCDRHRGIGADGVILVIENDLTRSLSKNIPGLSGYGACQSADIAWIYTNSDGSPSAMCGNGLRCLAVFAQANKMVPAHSFTVATAAGPVACVFHSENETVIDHGKPVLEPDRIPVHSKELIRFVKQPIRVDNERHEQTLLATCVSMGNPHCVIFDDRFDGIPYKDAGLARLAEQIQTSALFPEGVNVEFVGDMARDYARVLVWERGCGPTLACASGACAVLVAGVLEGRLDRSATIELPGGKLELEWRLTDEHVILTGPARQVFRGQVDLLHFSSLHGLLAAEANCL